MQIDTHTIDRIVAGVLSQLAAGGESARGDVTAQTHRRGGGAESVTIEANVVTAEVLLAEVNVGSRIVVSERAIVTPAAWDAAKERGIEIVRSSNGLHAIGRSAVSKPLDAKHSESAATASLLVIVVRNTDAVERLWDDLKSTCRRELLGSPDEAAAMAISAACRGEASTIVILAEQAHRAACLANRNERVNAAALSNAGDIRTINQQLRANVWCLDPAARSWFELRNLFRAITDN